MTRNMSQIRRAILFIVVSTVLLAGCIASSKVWQSSSKKAKKNGVIQESDFLCILMEEVGRL